MNKEEKEYLRTSINTIDGIASEIADIINDNDKGYDEGYAELLEMMESMADAVTEFQSFKGWI